MDNNLPGYAATDRIGNHTHFGCLVSSRSLIRQQYPPLSHLPHVLFSSEPLPVPDPDGSAKTYPEKLHTIVDCISQLTLLETAQLNELLKVWLSHLCQDYMWPQCFILHAAHLRVVMPFPSYIRAPISFIDRVVYHVVNGWNSAM